MNVFLQMGRDVVANSLYKALQLTGSNNYGIWLRVTIGVITEFCKKLNNVQKLEF